MRRTDAAALLLLAPAATSCFDAGERWDATQLQVKCDAGTRRCLGTRLEVCAGTSQGMLWALEEDCAARELVCAPELSACSTCRPGRPSCDGQTALLCDERGESLEVVDDCDPSVGQACRDGGCANLCSRAQERRSNVGCEYWAVDLDNARVDDTLNAAAQQFAVVLSNAQPDVPAEVTIEQDDSAPGEAPAVIEVARATVPPFSTRVFRLGPREVDGSAPGTFNTGEHTALSRGAYRVRSSFPIVAYQFNPLENVNVFSNDASLLKPVEALAPEGSGMADAYIALGWPQTIADTDDPRTDFDPESEESLRAFLTLVGTRSETRVLVRPNARVIAGGPVAETAPGEAIEITLDPFDVLNLETEDFNADFTGSLIQADGPVVVFTGNEASDAPYFNSLGERQCCADHLEEQLDPIRTAGRAYIATVSPNRTAAIAAAGGAIGEFVQEEYFRLIAVTNGGARVTTSLSGAHSRFELRERGDFVDIASDRHFAVSSDAPIMLGSVSPSQAASGVPRGLPGGDPSLLIVPPIEQFRATYVFLTPDKYSFDFVRIVAPPDAIMVFDGVPLEEIEACSQASVTWPSNTSVIAGIDLSSTPFWEVYTCQLSFPEIDSNLEAPENLTPGLQNDGVHRLESDRPVGVLVDGFDSFVSYAYAAGTELEFIVPL